MHPSVGFVAWSCSSCQQTFWFHSARGCFPSTRSDTVDGVGDVACRHLRDVPTRAVCAMFGSKRKLPKAKLYELCVDEGVDTPTYVTEAVDPDRSVHEASAPATRRGKRAFVCTVRLPEALVGASEREFVSTTCSTKREAEHQAAAVALEQLNVVQGVVSEDGFDVSQAQTTSKQDRPVQDPDISRTRAAVEEDLASKRGTKREKRRDPVQMVYKLSMLLLIVYCALLLSVSLNVHLYLKLDASTNQT